MTPDLPSAAAELTAGLSSLCSLLWQERVSLQVLLFKLVEEQLIARQGHTLFLQLADEELREAAGILHETEVLRAAETQMVARLMSLPPDASLAEIAERAEEPWPDLLREHGDALRLLLADIEGTVSRDRQCVLAGADAARVALELVGAPVATCDSAGRRLSVHHAWLQDRPA
jgi:hypothetical protein